MERVDGDGRHRLRFETLDDRPPVDALHDALDALDRRVGEALRQLAHQPEEAPRSLADCAVCFLIRFTPSTRTRSRSG